MIDWADIARRHGCKLRLRDGLATDRQGLPQGAAGCGTCQGCSQALGDGGITSFGQRIQSTQHGVHIAWSCPGCGCETIQETGWLRVESDAADAAADPLCYRCRKRPAGGESALRAKRERTAHGCAA